MGIAGMTLHIIAGAFIAVIALTALYLVTDEQGR